MHSVMFIATDNNLQNYCKQIEIGAAEIWKAYKAAVVSIHMWVNLTHYARYCKSNTCECELMIGILFHSYPKVASISV